MIEEMLENAALTWPNITKIAVGTGPGNFTGIRISVALARGLSLGLGVPAVGITGFVARAQGVKMDDFWVTIPAPRDQIYVQQFCANSAIETGPAQMLPAAQFDPNGAPVMSLADLTPAELALAIARAAAPVSAAPRPAPFYVRAADALPPSDPPPVILP
jgi:tRNA threonylcarbamoyl adenosine modification protein YeaZ